MKKLISVLLILSLTLLTLIACAPTDDTRLRVGYLTGPTGMGMSKLINDNGGTEGNDKYEFISYGNKVKEALTKLLSDNVDVICQPTQDVAEYVTTNESDLVVLALNTLGTLYLVGTEAAIVDSIDDLAGQTIYVPQNGTPKLVLEVLLDAYNVDATVTSEIDGTVIAEPAQLFAKIQNDASGSISLAVAPEPIVSNILMAKSNYSVKLDLSELWDAKYSTPIAMGCIVARKSFVEEHPTIIANFLNEYKASIEFVSNNSNLSVAAQYIVDAGILPKLPLANRALGSIGGAISYVDGQDMKATLVAFYNAVGISLPDESFYYVK